MEPLRIWRLRRRHNHIDAVLRSEAGACELTYSRNDRPLIRRQFANEELARADADERLHELQRAGWVVHW